MNASMNKAAEEALKAFQTGEAAKMVKDAMLDGVSKSQEASSVWAALCKDMGKTYEGLFMKAAANARTINEKVLDNATTNAKSMFDHAAKSVKTGDMKAAASSQIEFVGAQTAVLNEQQVELFDLTNAIAKDMFEASSAAAQATAERVKATA
ncbi:MAG: hypothetical protein AAGF81_14240 [Pseudomonadota bacterium]